MYRKVVKAGGNTYSYYYHNFRIGGKVRNLCLGNDLGKARKELKKLMSESKKKNKPISHVVRRYWKPA